VTEDASIRTTTVITLLAENDDMTLDATADVKTDGQPLMINIRKMRSI
jgi:hypothetical protein